MVEFSLEDEVYIVKSPSNNLLVNEYNYLNMVQAHQNEPNDDVHIHSLMENKLILAVCCLISHLCICKSRSPLSCAARNVLKQISTVINGWFIGVMLGEALVQHLQTSTSNTTRKLHL